MNINLEENKMYGILSVTTNRKSSADYKYPDQEFILLFIPSRLLSAISYRELLILGNIKLQSLRNFFTFKHGTLSKSTLQRLLEKFNPTEMK